MPTNGKEVLMMKISFSKEILGMILLYALAFAAFCPWSLQNMSLVLLWIVSLFCATIPAFFLNDREKMIVQTIEKIRNCEEPERAKWKNFIRRIPLLYIPYIVLLFAAGQPTLALVWLFCYLALASLSRGVIKQLREEGIFK